MKYSIKGDGAKLDISVQHAGGEQPKLLEELQQCAEGRCACPTPQYAKLEAIDITPAADRVDITLKVKPGERIDQAEIARCLEHAAAKLSPR